MKRNFINFKEKACSNLTRSAEEYLDAARDSLRNGYPRLAVDAAYNSAELGVKAMLLFRLDDIPGSHGGVVGKFGELYVKSCSVAMGYLGNKKATSEACSASPAKWRCCWQTTPAKARSVRSSIA